MDKTFVKGLRLIEALAASDEPCRVTNLSRDLELTKSNVHRLLMTLAAHGYVSRVDINSSYELTPKIWEMGVRVRSRLDIVKVAQAQMAALAAETDESVHLSVLDGLEVIYVDKIESSHPIASYTRVGGRAPAWCVATGKAMLAHTLQDTTTIARQLKKFTEQTITTAAGLNKEFEAIRAHGYAVNRGEWRDGVYGIAAPVWDATGQVVGSIGISGPGVRFKPKQIKAWAGAVANAAASIARTLGYGKSSHSAPATRTSRAGLR